MISHKYKFIYIHVPKCGGTSVETSLYKYAEASMGCGWARKNRAWRNKELFDILNSYRNYYIFTTVREPVSRCISIYNHFFREINCGAKLFIDSLEEFMKHEPWLLYKDVKHNKTTCDNVLIPELWKSAKLQHLIGYHVLPQDYFIPKNISCDIYNLNDISTLIEHISKKYSIVVENKPQRVCKHKLLTRDKLSQQLIDKINDIYHMDHTIYNKCNKI